MQATRLGHIHIRSHVAQLEQAQNWHEVQPYRSLTSEELQLGTISPCYSRYHCWKELGSIIYLLHDARTCQPVLWPPAKPTKQCHAFMKYCMCSYTTLHCTSWGHHALGDLHAHLLPSQFRTGDPVLTSLSGSLCQGPQGIHPQKVVLM